MKNVLTHRFIYILIAMLFIRFGFSQDNVLTLEKIFKDYAVYPEFVSGLNSLNDGVHYYVIEDQKINIYSYESGEKTATMLSAEDLVPEGQDTPLPLRNPIFSQDENKILLATETESIYRYSSMSEYYVYDLESKKLIRLSENGKQRLATFSPDGSKVAFVRDNNIFIVNLDSGEEKQITFDGEYNKIINGTTDWVYEEEFAITKGFFWSPENEYLAYYKFDESNVKEFQFMNYGDLYPEAYRYKYPKAGEDNSVVRILIYNIKKDKTITVDIGEDTDVYIPRIKWTKDPDQLSVQWMNRLQNELVIWLAHAKDGETREIYRETNPYYIDITDNLTFLNDNKHFIITSEQDGFNHIYKYDLEGNMINQITSGAYDVIEFLGYDEKKDLIYYTSAESSPINHDFYVVKSNGKKKKKLSGDIPGHYSISLSDNYQYYIQTFTNATTPPVFSVYTSKGKLLRVLEDNSAYNERISEFQLGQKEFFNFETTEGVELNGWMIKPFDFSPQKKYPVLMYVYGGPGSQTVTNSWGYGTEFWFKYLANLGMIIFSVDNRGTGNRGEEFKKMTYLNLGLYETEDQIAAAKYLAELEYVNPEKIGIYGWSYGGYMSTLCITKGADIFNTAIAVAPVTNWRYYDNIYTERFMRTPQENPNGYDDNSPINHVEKMKGNYLLIHGTADDNVHVQNSMDLITALVGANKQFEMQLYPNSNHGIYTGRNTRYHLFNRMTNFITENLLSE